MENKFKMNEHQQLENIFQLLICFWKFFGKCKTEKKKNIFL